MDNGSTSPQDRVVIPLSPESPASSPSASRSESPASSLNWLASPSSSTPWCLPSPFSTGGPPSPLTPEGRVSPLSPGDPICSESPVILSSPESPVTPSSPEDPVSSLNLEDFFNNSSSPKGPASPPGCTSFQSPPRSPSPSTQLGDPVIFTNKQVKDLILAENNKLFKQETKKQRVVVKSCILLSKSKIRTLKVVSPTCSTQQDPSSPLVIFPREVWMQVFQALPTHQDILSCYRTCQLFKNLLEATVSKYMFKKIIPHVFSYLEANDVLKCRQVCKQWSTDVDNILAAHLEDRSNAMNGTICRLTEDGELKVDIQKRIMMEWKQMEEIVDSYCFYFPPIPMSDPEWKELTPANHLWKELKEHGRNPLVGRKLIINLEEPANVMCPDAEKLIHDFGGYVYHLDLYGTVDYVTPGRFYDLCVQSLKLCKNLKSIHLQACFVGDVDCETARLHLRRAITNNPLPEIKDVSANLVSFHFDGFTNCEVGIQHLFIDKFSTQMKYLSVTNFCRGYETFEWPKLEGLTVLSTITSAEIDNLAKLTAPMLKRLDLDVEITGNNILNLIRVHRQFEKTLSELILRVSTEMSGDVFADQEISSLVHLILKSLTDYRFSSITTLAILGQETLSNYDFLLLFPHVRLLAIQGGNHVASRFPADYENSLIDLGRTLQDVKYNVDDDVCTDQFRQSNVWKMLPRMREMHVEVGMFYKVFTREGYEHSLTQEDQKEEAR